MEKSENISRNRRVLFPVLIASLCVFIFVLAYSTTIVVRGLDLYGYVKRQLVPMQNSAMSVGRVFVVDPARGYALAPGGEGVYLIPKGEPIPFKHDERGLRVPESAGGSEKGGRPRVLFLGDSFTYGQLVRAEDSFAYKLKLGSNAEIINGGVPGYGLAHMLIQANLLIPRHKPDYVVVQYSPWLVTRAQTEFATDSLGLVMAPYFFEKAGALSVNKVPFVSHSSAYHLIEGYRTSSSGLADQISFLWHVAFPFLIHRDCHMVIFRVGQYLGLTPRAVADPERIAAVTYAEIDLLAKSNGGKMVVLALGTADYLDVPGWLFPPATAGVNGWLALVNRLEEKSSNEYVRNYFHWRGSPPEPVDWHPNERAHEVIAEALSERIILLERQRISRSLPLSDVD